MFDILLLARKNLNVCGRCELSAELLELSQFMRTYSRSSLVKVARMEGNATDLINGDKNSEMT